MPELCPVTAADAPALHAYYLRNQTHLARWEPVRDANYHTIAAWQARAAAQAEAAPAGKGYHFAIKQAEQIIGVCNFTNVQRGAFQACFLGYSVDFQHQRRGVMQVALTSAISLMFDDVGLNRIMANYMPANERSARLLSKLGFEKEGYAKRYLKIAGQWEDHVLTALINPAGSPE